MNNALCFVGPHRKYNPFSNQYHELVPGQGHFGPDAIPGDVSAIALHPDCHIKCFRSTTDVVLFLCSQARWRRGESVSLKAARDNMVSLEAAAHAQVTRLLH